MSTRTTTAPSATTSIKFSTARRATAPARSTASATQSIPCPTRAPSSSSATPATSPRLKGFEEDFDLLQKVEELGIPLIQERRHNNADMCANVDMYSGLVYTMLDIPEDVFTPLFASARIAGWCANRIEELVTCRRIMRPAYRAVTTHGQYIPMEQRTPHIQ